MSRGQIRTLFCDIGGVILTNGWDHGSRERASQKFGIDFKEFNTRHALIFGDYEVGKITLDDYLKYTVFFEPRKFSIEDFKKFVFDQSQPYPEMLDLVRRIKQEHGLKVVFLSNEGRELTEHRIKAFKLDEIGDFFVVSCFAGLKKPDRQIFHMAINMSQTPPNKIVYLDDRQLFVEIANDLGIHGICHKEIGKTRAALAALL